MSTVSNNTRDDLAVETWNSELYRELRQMAATQVACQAAGQTLQAAALVHEAWLKLGGCVQHWHNRAHFFGAAAQAMRQILVDQARRKAEVKHGGGQKRVELAESKIAGGAPDEKLLAINEALDRLAAHDAAKAELVKLRYFVGLTLAEAAEVLGISEPTAKRYWAYARAWCWRRRWLAPRHSSFPTIWQRRRATKTILSLSERDSSQNQRCVTSRFIPPRPLDYSMREAASSRKSAFGGTPLLRHLLTSASLPCRNPEQRRCCQSAWRVHGSWPGSLG